MLRHIIRGYFGATYRQGSSNLAAFQT